MAVGLFIAFLSCILQAVKTAIYKRIVALRQCKTKLLILSKDAISVL